MVVENSFVSTWCRRGVDVYRDRLVCESFASGVFFVSDNHGTPMFCVGIGWFVNVLCRDIYGIQFFVVFLFFSDLFAFASFIFCDF